ncbi:hypothetical protein Tco_0824325 [Tanacetum coccineum]|uniref:Uncharacterized protein n=1 Tax=Tanacetum coccineum TaxID=301880 RepID=A0ABQ5AKG2_9ASTR
MKSLRNKGRKKMKKRERDKRVFGLLCNRIQSRRRTHEQALDKPVHPLLGSKEVIDVDAFKENPVKAMISKERPVDNALRMDGACYKRVIVQLVSCVVKHPKFTNLVLHCRFLGARGLSPCTLSMPSSFAHCIHQSQIDQTVQMASGLFLMPSWQFCLKMRLREKTRLSIDGALSDSLRNFPRHVRT